MNNDKIVTPSFCYILAANFLLFFAFYLLLMPDLSPQSLRFYRHKALIFRLMSLALFLITICGRG